MVSLITPYGGQLVNLMSPVEEAEELKEYASRLPSVQLTERQLNDLELLATGAFSPLDRFMGHGDYKRVVHEMRLGTGHLFPIPITLSVNPTFELRPDHDLALRNSQNELLAVMTVEEAYEWELAEVAEHVFRTHDPRHPLISEMEGWGKTNISGRLQVFALPRRFDFSELRRTPQQTRASLEALGRANVVAFQTRNPLHRAHEELTKRAAHEHDATLLIHPAVGLTKPGDINHYTRVRTYQAMMAKHYEPTRARLALLPLAMRMAGPREALWHALIRRNYGANFLIIGRDHASPGNDSEGRPFYGAYDAQELVAQHQEELGVGMVPFRELVYLPHEDRYEEATRVPPGARTLTLSGSRVRDEYLHPGKPLPGWFTRPEVAEILAESYPPKHQQGVCIWFTGLSGAGKSTTAEILTAFLLEKGRGVTLLDGDVVRMQLSRGLGFSKEDRDANILRIGFVASEIVRHGGIAICAAVSPYRATRNEVRNLVNGEHFVEVFVDTPLAVCEQRDTKGMYAKARRGEIANFTGISDPYEPPLHPEITIITEAHTPEENAATILRDLINRGFVKNTEYAATVAM